MKRLLAAITLVFLLAVPSFATTNEEYGELMSNEAFARADRRLNRVYTDLKRSVSKAVWRVLSDEQKNWVDWGRDDDAEAYMDEGYSRTRAYTKATNDRADYLPDRAKEIARELRRKQ